MILVRTNHPYLRVGHHNSTFRDLFQCIIKKVMEVYQPDVVVLQCGADSLAGDRLGCFNLSVKGHAGCLHFLWSYIVPMMVQVLLPAWSLTLLPALL
jgi:acetoin utilization deacetylase AcuC-like enzyme